MSQASRKVLDPFRQLWEHGTLRGLSPEELLNRFVMRRDEQAFACLVSQFGPMVYSVCQSVLHDEHAADDAFQATFLLLARKAGSVRSGIQLGRWLHRTARRVATRAARQAARRPERTSLHELGEGAQAPAPRTALEPDLMRLLHEEVDRLPASHRAAVVACDLEGLSHQQAADQLRGPVGTVKGRLFRAHRTLQTRLTRRGVSPLVLPLATGGLIPYPLVNSTTHLAVTAASGSLKNSLVPAAVAALVTGEIHMIWLKTAVLSGCLLAAGTGLTAGAMKLAGERGAGAVGVHDAQFADQKQTSEPAAPKPANAEISSAVANQSSNLIPLLTPESRKELQDALQNLQSEREFEESQLPFFRKLFGISETRVIEAEKAILELEDQLSKKQTLGGKEMAEELDARNLRAMLNIRAEAQNKYQAMKQDLKKFSDQLRMLRDKENSILEQLSAPSAEPRRIRPGDTLVIEVLEALPGRPITGERLVRSDGTVGLFFYGDVRIAGLNRNQAKAAIIGHLRKYLSDGKLGLVVVDDRGNTLAIAPEQSAAVVVDDTPAEIEDLRRKRESDESRPNPVLRSRPTVLGNPQVPSPEKTDPE